MYQDDTTMSHPVSGGGGLTTPRATAIVVIGALVLLILIRHGFRGANVLGVSVSVK